MILHSLTLFYLSTPLHIFCQFILIFHSNIQILLQSLFTNFRFVYLHLFQKKQESNGFAFTDE